MSSDRMDISILEDGTIRIETDKVSGANHANAEQFFKLLAQNAGGESSRARKAGHTHTHTHEGAQVKQ